jgi:hypothetical protein
MGEPLPRDDEAASAGRGRDVCRRSEPEAALQRGRAPRSTPTGAKGSPGVRRLVARRAISDPAPPRAAAGGAPLAGVAPAPGPLVIDGALPPDRPSGHAPSRGSAAPAPG